MPGKVSIIMYHYVRNLASSRYPNIKGLDLEQFGEQIKYLQKYYHFISFNECVAALRGEIKIPLNSLALTFDDAYSDHYQNVFPILNQLGIQGWFFPPAKAILNKEVLDVNKIHFILATTDINKIIMDVNDFLDLNQSKYLLESKDFYFTKFAQANRFDSKEVVFIKTLLQTGLSIKIRKELVDILFRKYVTRDEAAFSSELYMSVDQIKCLVRNGMYVGSHGYDHFWLDSLTDKEQEFEINSSLKFLADVGSSTADWAMCYPYGNYNENVLKILRKKGCVLGLTTEVDIAELSPDNALVLPRLDTNDIPKVSNALPNEWTKKIMKGE